MRRTRLILIPTKFLTIAMQYDKYTNVLGGCNMYFFQY